MRATLIRVRDAVADSTGGTLAGCLPLARGMLRVTAPLAYQHRITRQFHRRVVDALARRLKARGGVERSLTIDSIPVTFDISSFCLRHRYFAGDTYEPETTQFFINVLRPGDFVLDVGANHGYFTVLAAHRVGPTGRVAAFEANPAAAAILRRHIEANHLSERVEITQKAVSGTSGETLQFFVGQDDDDVYSSLCPSSFAVEQGWLSSERSITVTTTSLDDWLAQQQRPKVRLLKIDVEGVEEQVQSGLTETLKTNPPDYIVCETTWESAAHRKFVAAGYTAERLAMAGDSGNVLFVRPGAVR